MTGHFGSVRLQDEVEPLRVGAKAGGPDETRSASRRRSSAGMLGLPPLTLLQQAQKSTVHTTAPGK